MQRCLRALWGIERHEIDPARVVTHTFLPWEAPGGYHRFEHEASRCEKVVLEA